jgi:hypothetical protein
MENNPYIEKAIPTFVGETIYICLFQKLKQLNEINIRKGQKTTGPFQPFHIGVTDIRRALRNLAQSRFHYLQTNKRKSQKQPCKR